MATELEPEAVVEKKNLGRVNRSQAHAWDRSGISDRGERGGKRRPSCLSDVEYLRAKTLGNKLMIF